MPKNNQKFIILKKMVLWGKYCSLKNSSNIFIFTYRTSNYKTQLSWKFEVIWNVSWGVYGFKTAKKDKRSSKNTFFGSSCVHRNSSLISDRNFCLPFRFIYDLITINNKYFEKTFRIIYTVKNTVISPDFLAWKFCGKAQFPHSFGRLRYFFAKLYSWTGTRKRKSS